MKRLVVLVALMAGPAWARDADESLVQQYRTMMAMETQPYGFVSCALSHLDFLEGEDLAGRGLDANELAATWSRKITTKLEPFLSSGRVAATAILHD